MAGKKKAELHASARRLLAAAREATDNPELDWSSIGKRLGASSAVMSNWKERGVFAAEKAYGCSPVWVLAGATPAARKPPSVKSFKDRPAPSNSQWAIIDAIDALPDEERGKRIESILEEGKKWKAISDQLVARARGDKD